MSDTDDSNPAPRNLPPARVRTRAPLPAPPVAAARVATESAPREEVGYGKPPRSTRFRPGQSGNPKGRPKGSVSLSTLVGEALDKKIVARIGDKSVSMSRRQAMVHRFMEKALAGDLRSFVLLTKLDPAGVAASTSPTQPDTPLTPEEEVMLKEALARAVRPKTGDAP